MVWTEVTDIKEINRLWNKLARQIRKSSKPWGSRNVGYPGANQPFDVRIGTGETGGSTWAYCGKGQDGRLLTLIGRTSKRDNWQLQIDLQVNFRSDKFSRNMGGVFLKDEDGNVRLANRGLITRGSRVKHEELERVLPKSWWSKGVGPRGKIRSFISLADLDSPTLFEDLAARARKLRERLPVAEESGSAGGNGKSGKSAAAARAKAAKPPDWFSGLLNGFKKDFEAKWKIPAGKPKTAKRGHGRIVNALLDELHGPNKLHTTKGIDLVVEVRKPRHEFHVFEVKTASDTQSTYTAIGQLVFNGGVLRHFHPNAKVKRYLVLPGEAKAKARQDFCRELGFEVVTYTLGPEKSVDFSGLKLG